MPRWCCPSCGRGFARVGQGHECAPAMTVDGYFATGPAHERPVFEAVLAYVESLGPVHIEPVSVGVFIKHDGSWIELRPKTKWVALCFPLQRTLTHARIARKPMVSGRRVFHVVNLRTSEDLDEDVRGWLAESYSLLS